MVLTSLLPASSALTKTELCCTSGRNCSSGDKPTTVSKNLNTSYKMISISTMCELPLLTWLRESLLCVNNSQIHFYSFDSDRKISSTPMLVHAEISNLPTHLANVCQPQPDTIMQVTKKLYRWEYFANTFNSQNIWWFCFPASGLWIKEYLWPIPQVQKVKKKMQLPTGLNLQPGRLVTLYAKLSQTWPFRAKSLSGYEQQQQSLPIKHTLVRFCRIF